jgi:hypothetical protein
MTLIERPANLGPDRSIVQAVTELCQKYGRVIVIEDDQVFSLDFLEYMLQALDLYADESRVYQVAAYMPKVDNPDRFDAYFLPYTKPRGWATWERAWSAFDWSMPGFHDMYRNWRRRWRFDLDGNVRYAVGTAHALRKGIEFGLTHHLLAWDFVWYWCVFRLDGVALFPRRSLVWVGGFDGSGVHSPNTPLYQDPIDDFSARRLSQPIRFPSRVQLDSEVYRLSCMQIGRDDCGTSPHAMMRCMQYCGEHLQRQLLAHYPAIADLASRCKKWLLGPPK